MQASGLQGTRLVPAQIQAEKGGGRPLEEGLRTTLERSVDLDLSTIRVHADAVAQRLTREPAR